ncbi:MAG: hypothetical protein ACJ749_16615 [Flavisolibacter sp.]
MKHTQKILVSLCIVLLIAGCKKQSSGIDTNVPAPPRAVDPNKVYVVPSTTEEKQLVDNLAKITDVLKELYKNKENLKLVNASIFSKLYTDESILLRDLIYPSTSKLKSNKKFETISHNFGVSLDNFANNFWAEVNKGNDQAFKTFLQSINRQNMLRLNQVDQSDVSIYSPYTDNMEFPQDPGGYYEPITTLVTATADADEGWGQQPYYVNGSLQYYTQVLVNDDYAFDNPTQIVGINGIEIDNYAYSANSAFEPTGPVDLPNLPREIKQVYVGDVRCKKQYDALISFTGNGGGSEIRFTRADGFLKVADGQVQADMYITGDKTISRKDIRKDNWVDFSNEWDADWELANSQENLAIYEEDNRNSSSFSGSLNTTLKLDSLFGTTGSTVGGSIGFTINYKSDDAIIKQTNLNRDVFFILNRTNLEGEMHNNWPVRDKTANVSFTLNDRTYF